jgi:hypothetical protein
MMSFETIDDNITSWHSFLGINVSARRPGTSANCKGDHPMPTTQSSKAQPASKDVSAKLNYIGDITGKARYDIRDVAKGNNFANSNIAWVSHEVTIHDARPQREALKFDETGFAFVRHRSDIAEDPALFEQNLANYHHTSAGRSAEYEQELCVFIKELSGAREVFPQLGGLLTRTSLRAEKKGWARPAYHVHLDFTAQASRQFLDQTLTAQGRKLAPFRRHVIYQTWRAVSPGPQDNTLAICDGSSVPLSDAVVVDSIIGPEEVPGNRFDSRMCRYRPTHRWYYLSDMEPVDLLLFKGFDSDIPDAMNAMHSSFDNPLGQAGVPRRSIEARFIAIFD